jgi:orotidine-5'-phosphate decarboxylase
MKPDNPIILALDYSDLNDARKILAKVRPNIGMIKIGLELFTAFGREALDLSKDFNIPVFLDLKLHDIPTTVEKTVAVACQMLARYGGEHFLSIHCFGGQQMCEAALRTTQGSNVKVVGVTVLTSLDEDDFEAMGFSTLAPGKRTVSLGFIGADCSNAQEQYDAQRHRILSGLTHFVCAPNQLELMNAYLGDDMIYITPGIRTEAEEKHDHARSKTAGYALRNGATWIVIGRPITQAPDPVAASVYFKMQTHKANHG